MEEKLDKLFHLKERGTTMRTEVLAGLTTFVTAAYVLAVNPSVMSATGLLRGHQPAVRQPQEDQPHDVCAGGRVYLEVRAHLACARPRQGRSRSILLM